VAGHVDLIIFDNIMTLITGDQKDEEGWRQVMPWVLSLTRRNIAQFWVHHTGHDETRSYGTKTREWQMDTVIHLTEIERPDTDVSFQWEFRKARERTPETRYDFADARIALVNDKWEVETEAASRRGSVGSGTKKFFEGLQAIAKSDDVATQFKSVGRQFFKPHPTATLANWQAECTRRGLIDTEEKPSSARKLFSRHKLSLIAANWIACDESSAWIIE
jgi:hypothetical protein